LAKIILQENSVRQTERAPASPLVWTGAVGLEIYLQPLKRIGGQLSPLLTPIGVLPGYTLAGRLWMLAEKHGEKAEDSKPKVLVLNLPARVRHGKRRGWLVDSVLCTGQDVHRVLQSEWGLVSQMACAEFSGRNGLRFTLRRPGGFQTRAAVCPFGPGRALSNPLALLHEKNRRIHYSVLRIEERFRWNLGGLKISRKRARDETARFKIASFVAKASRTALERPLDIDYRGFRKHH